VLFNDVDKLLTEPEDGSCTVFPFYWNCLFSRKKKPSLHISISSETEISKCLSIAPIYNTGSTEGQYAKTADKNGKGKWRRVTARNRSIALPPRPLYVRGREREREPVPILQKDGWALGPVRPGEENLVPTGVQTPKRQPLSQSLYRPQLQKITLEVFSYEHKIALSAN
jgi:hypothetical protein